LLLTEKNFADPGKESNKKIQKNSMKKVVKNLSIGDKSASKKGNTESKVKKGTLPLQDGIDNT
jgi:hypothetical protein